MLPSKFAPIDRKCSIRSSGEKERSATHRHPSCCIFAAKQGLEELGFEQVPENAVLGSTPFYALKRVKRGTPQNRVADTAEKKAPDFSGALRLAAMQRKTYAQPKGW